MSGYHSDADIPFGMFYGRIGRGVRVQETPCTPAPLSKLPLLRPSDEGPQRVASTR